MSARSRRTQKTKKTQSQSQVLRPFPAIRLRYATTQVRKPPVETPAHAHAPRIAAARGRHPAGRPLRTAAVVVSRRIPRLRYPGTARRRPGRKPRHPGSHSAFRHDRHRTETHSRSADRHSGRIRNHRPGTPLRTGRQNGLRRIAPRPAELRNRRMAPRRRKPRGSMRLFDRAESRRPSRRTRQNLPFHRPSRRLRTTDDPPGIRRHPLPEPLKPAAARHPAPGAFPEASLPVPARTGRRTARPSVPGARRTGPLQRYDARSPLHSVRPTRAAGPRTCSPFRDCT